VNSELHNLMNAVDVGMGSREAGTMAKSLGTVSRYHAEKMKFCNTDKYDKTNEEHEAMLKTVSPLFH